MSLSNPYTIQETIAKMRHLLSSTKYSHHKDALVLLEKALTKATNEPLYSQLTEETLLYGSTVKLREWLSVFGHYNGPPQATYPWYPHTDAVNAIDTVMHIIKLDSLFPGAIQDYIDRHK